MADIFTCNWTLSPVMDTVAAARFTAEHGFAGMEIESHSLDFWPTLVGDSTVAELDEIAKGEGVRYTIHAPDHLNPATDRPEDRVRDDEIFKRLLDLAVRLESPVVGVHPGVVHTLFALERRGRAFETARFQRSALIAEGQARAVATYARWGDLADDAGVTLTIENEVHVRHSAAPTARDLDRMIGETGREHIKVNLDTGHAFIGAGLAEEFEVLRRRIVHMHLNDGRTAGVSEHLPLGEGEADFSALAGFMAGFDGALVLEIYAPERPVEAMLESRAFLLEVQAGA